MCNDETSRVVEGTQKELQQKNFGNRRGNKKSSTETTGKNRSEKAKVKTGKVLDISKPKQIRKSENSNEEYGKNEDSKFRKETSVLREEAVIHKKPTKYKAATEKVIKPNSERHETQAPVALEFPSKRFLNNTDKI